MNALSNPKSLVYLTPNPNQSTQTRIHESVSFASQMTKTRISIRNQSGPSRARKAARIEAFYAPAGTAESSLYEVLGIEESGSTLSDIKKAYRNLARKYHPDVSPPDRVDEHTRKFIMVKEAYETLANPQSKALYDRDLANGLGFGYSPRNPYHHDQEQGEWRIRWQSQLDGLKRRTKNSSRMSWGARMRTQT